jgi:hypothetical protein
MTDYQRGYDGLPPSEDTDWNLYNQGKNDRAVGVPPPRGAWGGATDVMRDEFREGRIKFYVKWLAQTAMFSAIAGGLAGGVAFLSKKPPEEIVQWALMGAGVVAAFCLVLLAAFTVGVLLGVAFNVATLPLLLWRWLLGFAILGAGAGYLSGTIGGAASAIAQQRALQFALWGLLVGLVVGAMYRLIRRLRRHGAPAT